MRGIGHPRSGLRARRSRPHSRYDAGKKLNGRKRHIVTDTLGIMLFVLVHAADVQDRDGAPALLQAIRHRFPWLRHIFADGGYAGGKLRDALKLNLDTYGGGFTARALIFL